MPVPALTVGRALSTMERRLAASGVPDPRAEAAWILSHALRLPGIQTLPRGRVLSNEAAEAVLALAGRRERHEPLQHVLGQVEFCSLLLRTAPGVLIPRPETELVVTAAIDRLRPGGRALDAGTGSGCIAIALAAGHPDSRIVALDRSPRALRLARRNAAVAGVSDRVTFVLSDFSIPCFRGRFNLLVSNPPYVSREDLERLPHEVRGWEPEAALDGGRGGLSSYRALLKASARLLDEAGWLVLELPGTASEPVRDVVRETGLFGAVEVFPDLSGRPRVLCAPRLPFGS